jgi:hypothetical protein
LKTLFELCKPRQSVFDETKREDVLNLTDLVEGKIDPAAFFEETYLTEGMKLLFETAFNRFVNKGATGVVKLTQAMGGGKTHNILALGLLALNPEYREQIIGKKKDFQNLGKVRVAAFSGRESDAPFGIWGSIAEQLGKRELFQQYYTPLAAPGETAWINLLQGEPLLILLDELPPYLQNAKSIMIGNSDLAMVTTTALSNLFSALGKSQLSNVCLVISDLTATYESGSELLRSTFKELNNEVNRSALNIEPVGSSSDEVYYILRKRLFETLPSENEINQVAVGYKDAVAQAKQMGFTNIAPDHIYAGIKDSYPFHPSIKDLYARFKENQGFQQTRGLIRLMRQIVAQLYSDKQCVAKKKYLINVFDFNLNERLMLTTVTQIKQSLTNAIAHDITANGKAIAEEIDSQLQHSMVQDVSKLILVASLADIPNALLGLTLQEIIGNLCEPGRDITELKRGLDEFQMKAWYLEHDKEGKLFFKNTKNIIAELHSLVESYDNESVKSTTLKKFLEEKFKPTVLDCYQNMLIFPAVDEIDLSVDKVTLVLFEPYSGNGLHPDLKRFFDNAMYKNRVLFLSGQRDTMNRLYTAAKELKAIERIIANMKDDKVPEDNQQYLLAQDTRIKKITAVLSAAQQTFSMIYYPNKNGIQNADFSMEFKGNNYNGEDQIRKLLLEKQKLLDKTFDDTFRRKCEDRLFTRKEMQWAEIRDRAATETAWQWHHPGALNKLREDCITKDLWRERGDYLEKGPFPKEPTSLSVTVKNEDDEYGQTTLWLRPMRGDKVYYEIGAAATPSSLLVDDLSNFVTTELRVSFLCVDSTREHPAGETVEWRKAISLRHRIIDKADGQWVQLQSHPGVKIKYTTDGSDPKENGGIYDGGFAIPVGTTFVQAVAECFGEYYAPTVIKIEKKKQQGLTIDRAKTLTLYKCTRASDTNDTFEQLNLLKKYAENVADVHLTLFPLDAKNNQNGFIDVTIDAKIPVTPEQVETAISTFKNSILADARANIELEYGKVTFTSGQSFYDWANTRKISLTEFKQEEIRQR